MTADGLRRLTLQDKDRKVRAQLDVNVDDTPDLKLFDKDENKRIELTATEQLPGLVLWDANNPRAMLSLLEQGPGLVLFDTNFKQRATLGLTENAASLGSCQRLSASIPVEVTS